MSEEVIDIPEFPEKPTKKVAIVAYAPSRVLAPFNDPTWEIWGLNELYGYIPDRWDVWFEPHSAEVMRRTANFEKHHEWLKAQTKPIYMKEHYPGIPASVAYPIKQVLDRFGTYFNNSVSWLIALAILEGATEIALYGVDMALGTEYSDQRPSCEYMIGFARGMGIPVYVPTECDLLKSAWLYGFEDEPKVMLRVIAENADLATREAHAESELQRIRDDLFFAKGAKTRGEDFVRRYGRG